MPAKIHTLLNVDDYPQIIQIFFDEVLNGFRDITGKIIINMSEILKPSQIKHFKESGRDYNNAVYKHRTCLFVAVFIERYDV